MSDDVIERVARAVADLEETNGLPPLYQDIATAALSALRAGDPLPGGLVVMPVEPNNEMLSAAMPAPSEWIGHTPPPPGTIERWRARLCRRARRWLRTGR